MDFIGAKVVLYLGSKLVVILRDDFDWLPYAGYWDLPGGGREGAETPFECVARETFEELGLCLDPTDVLWSRAFGTTATQVWFFVASLPVGATGKIRFGDEGQGWSLMSDNEFLTHSKVVPDFQDRLRVFKTERGDFHQESPPLP